MGARAERGTGGASSAVRLWLAVVAALVIAMVAVGGGDAAHRIGPVDHRVAAGDGVIPPLSDADWAPSFAKYRATRRNTPFSTRAWASRPSRCSTAGNGATASRAGARPRLLPAAPRVLVEGPDPPPPVGWGLLALACSAGCRAPSAGSWFRLRLQPGMTAVAPSEARPPSHHREPDPRRPRLARGGGAAGRPGPGAFAPRANRADPAAARFGADLPRRPGGGLPCRARLQHVAGHGRGADPLRRPPVRRVLPWIENFVDNHMLVQFEPPPRGLPAPGGRPAARGRCGDRGAGHGRRPAGPRRRLPSSSPRPARHRDPAAGGAALGGAGAIRCWRCSCSPPRRSTPASAGA